MMRKVVTIVVLLMFLLSTIVIADEDVVEECDFWCEANKLLFGDKELRVATGTAWFDRQDALVGQGSASNWQDQKDGVYLEDGKIVIIATGAPSQNTNFARDSALLRAKMVVDKTTNIQAPNNWLLTSLWGKTTYAEVTPGKKDGEKIKLTLVESDFYGYKGAYDSLQNQLNSNPSITYEEPADYSPSGKGPTIAPSELAQIFEGNPSNYDHKGTVYGKEFNIDCKDNYCEYKYDGKEVEWHDLCNTLGLGPCSAAEINIKAKGYSPLAGIPGKNIVYGLTGSGFDKATIGEDDFYYDHDEKKWKKDVGWWFDSDAPLTLNSNLDDKREKAIAEKLNLKKDGDYWKTSGGSFVLLGETTEDGETTVIVYAPGGEKQSESTIITGKEDFDQLVAEINPDEGSTSAAPVPETEEAAAPTSEEPSAESSGDEEVVDEGPDIEELDLDELLDDDEESADEPVVAEGTGEELADEQSVAAEEDGAEGSAEEEPAAAESATDDESGVEEQPAAEETATEEGTTDEAGAEESAGEEPSGTLTEEPVAPASQTQPEQSQQPKQEDKTEVTTADGTTFFIDEDGKLKFDGILNHEVIINDKGEFEIDDWFDPTPLTAEQIDELKKQMPQKMKEYEAKKPKPEPVAPVPGDSASAEEAAGSVPGKSAPAETDLEGYSSAQKYLDNGNVVSLKDLQDQGLTIDSLPPRWVNDPDNPNGGYYTDDDYRVTYPDGSTADIIDVDQFDDEGKGIVYGISSEFPGNPDIPNNANPGEVETHGHFNDEEIRSRLYPVKDESAPAESAVAPGETAPGEQKSESTTSPVADDSLKSVIDDIDDIKTKLSKSQDDVEKSKLKNDLETAYQKLGDGTEGKTPLGNVKKVGDDEWIFSDHPDPDNAPTFTTADLLEMKKLGDITIDKPVASPGSGTLPTTPTTGVSEPAFTLDSEFPETPREKAVREVVEKIMGSDGTDSPAIDKILDKYKNSKEDTVEIDGKKIPTTDLVAALEKQQVAQSKGTAPAGGTAPGAGEAPVDYQDDSQEEKIKSVTTVVGDEEHIYTVIDNTGETETDITYYVDGDTGTVVEFVDGIPRAFGNMDDGILPTSDGLTPDSKGLTPYSDDLNDHPQAKALLLKNIDDSVGSIETDLDKVNDLQDKANELYNSGQTQQAEQIIEQAQILLNSVKEKNEKAEKQINAAKDKGIADDELAGKKETLNIHLNL